MKALTVDTYQASVSEQSDALDLIKAATHTAS